jgi:hypothetical protein
MLPIGLPRRLQLADCPHSQSACSGIANPPNYPLILKNAFSVIKIIRDDWHGRFDCQGRFFEDNSRTDLNRSDKPGCRTNKRHLQHRILAGKLER